MIRGFKNKKVLHKWIASYLLVLFIPIACIFLTQMKAKDLIEDEISKAHALSLEQVKKIIDEEIEDLINVNYELYYQDKIRAIANQDSELSNIHRYMLYEIEQELKNLTTYNDLIKDINVYFHNLDIIVSKENALSTREYYDRYYIVKEDYYKFKQLLMEEYNYQFLPVYIENDEAMLYLIKSIPVGNSEYPAVNIMIEVDQEVLRQILQQTLWMDNGQTSIVFGQGDNAYFIDSLSKIDSVQISEENYLKSTVNLFKEDIQYISFIPKHEFLNSVNELNRIGVIFLLLSIVSGIIVSYYFSKINYNPLEKIIKQLNASKDSKLDNEYAIIEQKVSRLLEEHSIIEDTRKNKQLNLRNSALMALLSGTTVDEKEITRILDFCRLDFKSDLFIICFVEIENYVYEVTEFEKNLDEDTHHTNQFIVWNIINEMLSESWYVNFVEYPTKQVIIINMKDSKQGSITHLSDTLNTAKNYIEYNFKLQLSISLSHLIQGVSDLGVGYEQADEVMRYKVILGKGLLLNYSEVIKNMESKSYMDYNIMSLKNQNLYMNLIISHKLEEALELVDELLTQQDIKPDQALYFFYNIKSLTINGLNNLEIYKDKMNLNIDRLIDAASANELYEALEQLFNEIDNIKGTDSEQKVIVEIIHYIDHHYLEYELNVTQIAEHFQLRLPTLSKEFKEATGVGVLDYINGKRIAFAEDKLLNTNITISTIAKEAGFINSSSFIRVFKKINDMTPGAFRQTHQK